MRSLRDYEHLYATFLNLLVEDGVAVSGWARSKSGVGDDV
jgi:hypothetical protein